MIFHTPAHCRARASVHIFMLSWAAALLVFTERPARAADFSCPSRDVTCLIASINSANAAPGPHVITLAPGTYTLSAIDNTSDGPNGLPSVAVELRIQRSATEPPTIIERDSNAPFFRILHVSTGGALTLDGVTLQRGAGGFGTTLLNRGTTTLQESVVANNILGEAGAVHNFGMLNVVRSIITDNESGHEGGGINNESIGTIVVENSTISHNASADGGGIFNRGSLTIRNSAIISNTTDCCQPGGGVLNFGGSVEIVNTTIAKNRAGGAFGRGGGGIANFGGDVSLINSTVRENEVVASQGGIGGGLLNDSGTLEIQNTIVAANRLTAQFFAEGPDCFGTVTSLGNNLIGDLAGCDISLQPSDLTGDPGLGPLLGAGEGDLPGGAHYPVRRGSAVIDQGNPAACPATDQLGSARSGPCDIGAVEFSAAAAAFLVRIDMLPERPNRINLGRDNSVTVAILSRRNFNASTVDVATVRFGPTGSEAAPVGAPRRRDVNGDGRGDLILRFRIAETGIVCGDSTAAISGQVRTGDLFSGSTRIRTTGCN